MSDRTATRVDRPELARTLLFVPGSRPDRYLKAEQSGADLIVVDLEDAVEAEAKDTARNHLADYLSHGHRTAARINGAGTDWYERDVEQVAELCAAVIVPKAEPGPRLTELGARLQRFGTPLIALVETATGVLGAQSVAATAGVRRLAFGSLDLAAELGVDPFDRQAMAQARSAIVLASAAAGLPGPIDGVWTAVDDELGLREDTAWGRRLGFFGKLCIHPSQVPVVDELLAATADERAWAERVVAAAAAADNPNAVLAVDGAMVDQPVLARARRILER